jgi:hypothetical protein
MATTTDQLPEVLAVQIATANERLRQEQETFNRRMWQDKVWFWLKFSMGVVAVVTLPSIGWVAGQVLLNPGSYNSTTLAASAVALVTDILAVLGSVWKIVLSDTSVAKLEPVTPKI